MSNAPHLEVAASVYILRLREISDRIVVESWRTADTIVQARGSNAIVSTSIEIIAFLLHALLRFLPRLENDYLNDLVHGPLVHLCAEGMGEFVEAREEGGVFSMAVFSADAVEKETYEAIDSRGEGYARCAALAEIGAARDADVITNASRTITEMVAGRDDMFAKQTTEPALLQALETLHFAKLSADFQQVLTLELRNYLQSGS